MFNIYIDGICKLLLLTPTCDKSFVLSLFKDLANFLQFMYIVYHFQDYKNRWFILERNR